MFLLDQLNTNFHEHSDGEFIVMQGQFATMLETNPLGNSLPEPRPGPQRHMEYADQLTKEYDAFGKSGGKLPTRAEAEEAIKVTATYFCIVAWAKKDPSTLDNLGLEQKTRSYLRHPETVPAPPDHFFSRTKTRRSGSPSPGCRVRVTSSCRSTKWTRRTSQPGDFLTPFSTLAANSRA